MRRLQLALSLLLAAALAGCGGEPEPEDVQSQPAAQTRQPAQTVRPPTDRRIALGTDQQVKLKAAPLTAGRYLHEMSSWETEEAYRQQRGDFIDPRRVIELLREDEQLEQPDEAAEQAAAARTWRISRAAHTEALELFRGGSVAAAARRWGGVLTDQQALTISVEVDCDAAMLSASFERLMSMDAPVFVHSLQVGSRQCYRLCVGVFFTRSAAEQWIRQIRNRLPESHPFITVVHKESSGGG